MHLHRRHGTPMSTILYRLLMGFMTREGLVRYVDPPADPGAPPPGAPPAAPPGTPPIGDPPAGPGSIVGDASGKPAPGEPPAKDPPAPPAAPTKDEQVAFLTAKGVKPEDIGKLDDAGLKAKHDELKAADAKTEAVSKIEIKVPEGTAVNPEQLQVLKEVVADANLSPSERGQKLFDMHAAAMKDAVEGPVALWMKTQKEWQATVKADPEMGGAQYQATTEAIGQVFEAIGGAEAKKMREAFVFTGAGNHPEIVRMMSRVGKLLGEGKHVSGTALGAASGDLAERARSMYPSASDGIKAA